MSALNQEALSPEQARLVRRHLEQIKASHAFTSSKRSQDFLAFVVERALRRDLDSLRERMIGVEMFGRPIDYDTGNDSVVRVKATEVRRKLAEYYLEAKDRSPVRIDLPRGSYVPRFVFASVEAAPESAPEDTLPGDAEPQSRLESARGALAADLPGTGRAAVEAAAAMASEPPAVGLESTMPGRPDASFEPRSPDTSAGAPGTSVRATNLWTTSFWTGAAGRWVTGAALLFLLLASSVGFFLHRTRNNTAAADTDLRSIAVLPLANLSGDSRQEYFADGITEELINDLGQVSTLRVISLTSSLSYRGTHKNLPEIARELKVRGVVEGGVLREGDQVHVSVQLIDVRKDRLVWAHTYVRDLNTVLAWQGGVARAIADAISVDVTPQEQARLAHKSAIDPQAQDLYLHGALLREKDDCKSAIVYFDRAIQVDSSYAEPHSALATCYGMLGESGRMPYIDALTQQKAEALKAIELDDSLSEAHAELANTEMTLDWDWQAAALEFRRALELNPNSATNHEKYAFYLLRTGHPRQAVAEIERSVELDPVSASTLHAEGFVYYFARQYPRALAVMQAAQGLNLNLDDWSFLAGDIYCGMGRFPEAIAAFLKSGNGPYSLGHLGNAYARAGQRDAALKTIDRIRQYVQSDGVGRYEIALIYAGLGDKNNAFQWLEAAYRAHDVGLVYLKVDPCLDPLRSDPRFTALLQKVGLAPSPS